MTTPAMTTAAMTSSLLPPSMPTASILRGIGIAGRRCHTVSTVAIPGQRFAAEGQTAETEQHQQAENYYSL